MSWIKQNENYYVHSDAPYTLQYIGSTWYVVDNRDQSKSIPFSDIFNNPVFSVDFSNSNLLVNSLSSATTVLANHLRGEAANTPSTPAHSFKTEINSGLYRESAGVMAFSSLGNKVLTINEIPSFLCKAWISFDGSVTSPTPSGSGNISSITKNGTGDYTISFSTPMSNANYSIYMSSKQNGANYGCVGYPLSKLAGSFRFIFINSDPIPAPRDQSEVSLGIFA